MDRIEATEATRQVGTYSRAHALGGGAVAGLIGRVVLSVIMVATALAHGQDIWPAFKGSSAPFFHDRAHAPGFDAPVVMLGVACHFAVSIVWGMLFGVVCFGLTKGATVIAGAVWGLVVWAGMFYVVLPLAGLAAMTHATPIGPAIIQHVVFGLVVGLGFLPYQRPHDHERPLPRAHLAR